MLGGKIQIVWEVGYKVLKGRVKMCWEEALSDLMSD